MLACTTRTCVKCDLGAKCGKGGKGSSGPDRFQPIHTICCMLNPCQGTAQTPANLIMYDDSSRTVCDKCCAVKQGTMQTAGMQYACLPVVLCLCTFPQQVTSSHCPSCSIATHNVNCAVLAVRICPSCTLKKISCLWHVYSCLTVYLHGCTCSCLRASNLQGAGLKTAQHRSTQAWPASVDALVL